MLDAVRSQQPDIAAANRRHTPNCRPASRSNNRTTDSPPFTSTENLLRRMTGSSKRSVSSAMAAVEGRVYEAICLENYLLRDRVFHATAITKILCAVHNMD